jgi:hypothetical protein
MALQIANLRYRQFMLQAAGMLAFAAAVAVFVHWVVPLLAE